MANVTSNGHYFVTALVTSSLLEQNTHLLLLRGVGLGFRWFGPCTISGTAEGPGWRKTAHGMANRKQRGGGSKEGGAQWRATAGRGTVLGRSLSQAAGLPTSLGASTLVTLSSPGRARETQVPPPFSPVYE